MDRLLIITLGDPFSINVAGVLSFLDEMRAAPFSKVLVGSRAQWDDQTRRLGREVALSPYVPGAALDVSKIYFWETGPEFAGRGAETLTSKERGEIAVKALEVLPHVKAKRLAVLTSPIDKAACREAGFKFHGQTEYFEQVWNALGIMVLAGPRLRVGLATNHMALSQVPQVLTKAKIEQKIRLLAKTVRHSFGIERPRLAVCGLNPHAGDQGLFGWEDEGLIKPAVAAMRHALADVEIVGPESADTVFHRAAEGAFDAVLAMYHDQGLGPLKTLHFYDAVNITGGLENLRVSPDHGPARDLFLRPEARFDSFRMAWEFCRRYLET